MLFSLSLSLLFSFVTAHVGWDFIPWEPVLFLQQSFVGFVILLQPEITWGMEFCK